MALISWGKCRLFTKNVDKGNSVAYELATPVEDSTELTPTKGDKLEAKIEGGENEDVKYKRSTYVLAYNIRKAKGRKAPFPSVDGLVDDHFGIMCMPEDSTCEGFLIESSTVGVDDTYTTADGAIWAVQHDAVKAQTGDTVKWGTVTVSENSVTFTERSSVEEGGTPYTVTWTLNENANTNGAAGTSYTYTAVSTSSTGYSTKNPQEEGWYERTGESENYTYRLTWDEEPIDGKTYYTRS